MLVWHGPKQKFLLKIYYQRVFLGVQLTCWNKLNLLSSSLLSCSINVLKQNFV